MPAAVALVAPVISLRPVRPEPVRLVRSGRECPVCSEHHPKSSADCSAEFAARSWADCQDCAGTGWDSTGFGIWCLVCGGAKVLEVTA
ncbi:hypothetical protein KCMC57_up31800 [Kitasatospora sp. CMC57]|uniref:Uncharacterized protein n=1 Tax=Kitasatospora sp. CMC57 TaxID=3231513 RepID=A0AB33JXR3_9ACTN